MSEVESLIDPTRFATVRSYLNRPGSSITEVLFVRDEAMLSRVAELLTEEHATHVGFSKLDLWISHGLVRLGVNARPAPENVGRVVDIDTIPDDAFCRVLFLPPYYLVHCVN